MMNAERRRLRRRGRELSRGLGGRAGFFFRRGRSGAVAALFLATRALLLRELDRLADAVAEVEELGPAGLAAALHHHLADERRVQREDALDAFVVDDAAYGERLAGPAPALHDHGAGEDLD